MTARPWLTIGVPTRDRPVELAGLVSLLATELPALRERWRVQVVLADGSTTPAATPDVKADDVVVVPVTGGVSAGRNAIARVARGEVLVLVDDDVRPHAGAVAALAVAAGPGTAVAGRVAGLGHHPGEPSSLGVVARHGFGAPVPAGEPADYAVSALLALPRDVYTCVAWDERFAAAHLDDVAYGLRLRAAGVRLAVCDAATADHPPRHRKDDAALARLRAHVVLTKWAGDPAAWARCLAHVAWSHRRRPDVAARAVAHYLGGTREWRLAG